MEHKGIEYLKKKLRQKQTRVKLRYHYYEMKEKNAEPEITIPRHLRAQYKSTIGWCSKAVDSLADRLIYRGFSDDILDIQQIYNANNPDVLTDSAILSALISSCSFIYISQAEDGYPRLQVLDGSRATGIIDDRTGLMTEGYAVLECDSNDNVIADAYFTPERTLYFTKGKLTYINEHKSKEGIDLLKYCALVPIINRPDAKRPFGHSVISRACMYWQDYAKRTLERSDITAEFYSFPQKYVVGTSPDADQLETWKATISTFLQFDKDSDGDSPRLGQFTTPSMSPFTEQLRTAAAGFAGETGLTLDDLGFATDNPSSADAIRAAHESLRIEARKAQRTFGTGLINAGYIAACLRDGVAFDRAAIYGTQVRWDPLFTPDAASMGVYGDAIYKINQVIPNYLDEEKISDMLGI